MCGIAGVVGQGAHHAGGEVGAMLEAMRHRGPDGMRWTVEDRFLAFGVARLAVQGRGDPTGPYRSEDGLVAAVFNGEIYNHRELRRLLLQRGHRLEGESDGAILPHLYEEYGMAMLDRLVGMFAIAIYDRREGRLYLARDRLGIKPLYVWSQPGQWRFASELKAFLGQPGFPPRLRHELIPHYLSYRFVPAPYTLLFGVDKVLPGSYWQIDQDGEVCRHQWWRLSPEPERPEQRGLDEAAEEFAALWETVVQDHLMAERRVGIFLSAGVDSGWLALEAVRHPVSRPVAVILDSGEWGAEYDEAPQAQALAEELHLPWITARLPAPDLAALQTMAQRLDEPLGDPTVFSFEAVAARAASAGLTVMLSGEGADEVLAGYPHYREAQWLARLYPCARLLSRLGPARRWLSSPRWGTRRLMAALRSPAESYRGVGVTFADPGELGPPAASAIEEVQRLFSDLAARPRLQQMLAFDLLWYLADDALLKTDRIGMAYGLEVRVPYLDHRVVEWAWRLPPSFLLRGTEHKRVLRRAVHRRHPGLARRPKRGFPTPLGLWLAESLTPLAVEVLTDSTALGLGWYDPALVSRLAASVRPQGSAAGRKLYALLMLVLWHQAFLSRGASLPKGERRHRPLRRPIL